MGEAITANRIHYRVICSDMTEINISDVSKIITETTEVQGGNGFFYADR